MTKVFTMTSAQLDGRATATGDSFRALLAVSEAIVAHHDFAVLFHELAGLLHHVVCFDYPTLFLHDAARSAPRAAPAPPRRRFPGGASRPFPSSPHSNLSATRYRSLPCEETHRKPRRQHGPCFRGGCRETQDRA
jgi:hypothetical protein